MLKLFESRLFEYDIFLNINGNNNFVLILHFNKEFILYSIKEILYNKLNSELKLLSKKTNMLNYGLF